ncbi:hypothetical protein K1719_017131 [Acacia pycnantha]|nr:hypothetical protein K1719_017131 [Acacia pycnantha]
MNIGQDCEDTKANSKRNPAHKRQNDVVGLQRTAADITCSGHKPIPSYTRGPIVLPSFFSPSLQSSSSHTHLRSSVEYSTFSTSIETTVAGWLPRTRSSVEVRQAPPIPPAIILKSHFILFGFPPKCRHFTPMSPPQFNLLPSCRRFPQPQLAIVASLSLLCQNFEQEDCHSTMTRPRFR